MSHRGSLGPTPPQPIGGVQAYLAALGSLDIRAPLVDNQPLGDFFVRLGFFISADPHTVTVPINLQRRPSFFFATTNSGAVVYATSSDRALWGPTQIVLRATVSTLADIIVG